MIENTSKRDPLIHHAGMLGGTERYITEQESAGQSQLVHSDLIPTEGSDGLEGLGFALGDVVKDDPLFRHCTLPEGWSKNGTDHAMHSEIVDQHGRKRVGIFYKAAFYDRRADCYLIGLHAYLWGVADGSTTLVLDDVWATKDAVTAMLRKMIDGETRDIAEWTALGNGGDPIKRHMAARASYQRVLDKLTGPPAAARTKQ